MRRERYMGPCPKSLHSGRLEVLGLPEGSGDRMFQGRIRDSSGMFIRFASVGASEAESSGTIQKFGACSRISGRLARSRRGMRGSSEMDGQKF